jgi:LuxR family maltose regulon positive regulatory protein
LSLISAPAGFGKTTLVAEWLAHRPEGERSVAWVSLHPGDNDPARFWAYVIGALQTVRTGVGAQAHALLQALQAPPIESVLIALINDCARFDQPVTLVLDDYHVIEQQSIHAAIAFLLDHLPPGLRLTIISRADPPLPLARLRARGDLTELRVADLRFTPDEAAAFLTSSMGLMLPSADIAQLEERTEGWIAGLQLAALSLQGHGDAAGFIQSFTGNHRYIVDYLVNEVLQRQPDEVRDFLMQTAVLERLTGSLCDTVTGQEGGAARLEALEQQNLFLVPLDDVRQWYRFHHLFADVLRAHLTTMHPGLVPILHQRASEWFEQRGFIAEAIGHALAAGNSAGAADLVELSAPDMLRKRQEATLLGWLRSIPDAELERRPVLGNLYAGVLMQTGEFDGVLARLQAVGRLLEAADTGQSDLIIRDPEQGRQLPASIAVHRAGYALMHGDVAETVRHATRARELLTDADVQDRGALDAILGLAYWTDGDLEHARQSYAEGMESLHRAGFLADSVGGMNALGDICIAQGRLHEAKRNYEQALRLTTGSDAPVLRGMADMHVGLANLQREWNQLDASREHLRLAAELGELNGFPQFPHRWRIASAMLALADGDHAGALTLLDEAERRYVGDFHPNVRPIAAIRARVWIAQGRANDAVAWARAERLDRSDLGFLHEFGQVTLARALVARYRTDRNPRYLHEAAGLLDRLLIEAERDRRNGSVIDILLAQALAYAVQSEERRALEPLRRAMALAEPEGYIRTFYDDPETMRSLLRHCVTEGPHTAYAQRLLAGLDSPVAPPPGAIANALAEPLTPREIEILRLIAAGLRNEEIAGQLFIDVATVKRHIANLYGKLQVTHRTEAVARANELRLL